MAGVKVRRNSMLPREAQEGTLIVGSQALNPKP